MDEQAMIDQVNASKREAEALMKAEEQNQVILDQLEEANQRVKDYQAKIKEMAQEIQDRDYEINHYRTLADEIVE